MSQAEFPAAEVTKLARSAVKRFLGRLDYDIAQDTVISAWKSWARFDPSFQLSTWVNRIADCRCKDQQKMRGRTRKRETQYGADHQPRPLTPIRSHSAPLGTTVADLFIIAPEVRIFSL